MQYFAWGTDRPDGMARRRENMESHWDFIARYDDRLIARGPVLDIDSPGDILGSIHIAELKDDDEARHFVHDEPFAVAGLFADIVLTRFDLELGRTQFAFESDPSSPRFFVYCPAAPGTPAVEPANIAAAHQAYCRDFDKHAVCRGSLLTMEGNWAGRVFFLEMADRAAVESFLANDPAAQAGLYAETRIYRWTMGGADNIRAAGLLK